MMNFTDYQASARSTAIYPNQGNNFVYPALGLAGETGEVCEKLKKAIRDDDGKITKEKHEDLKKELGDILWYVAALCSELGISMDEVAQLNVDKLFSRKERGQLRGSGDDR